MLTKVRSNRSNLSNDIDKFKNYYEHRQRIEQTRNMSPFGTMKKSLSYDRQKLALHEYLKSIKVHSNCYQRRQAIKHNEVNDTKMLQNILQYDQKQFVFSMNHSSRNTNSSLHHNSLVSNHQKGTKIDQQNQRIHFRISKAKSLYSHLNPCKSAWGTIRQLKTLEREEEKKEDYRGWKVKTQEDVLNQEEMTPTTAFKLSNDFTGSHIKLKYGPPQLRNLAVSDQFQKKELNRDLIFSRVVMSTTTSKRACERLRRQKLAQNLFEKKQKLQASINSKISIKSKDN